MICPTCGTSNRTSAAACAMCGNLLGGGADSVAAPAGFAPAYDTPPGITDYGAGPSRAKRFLIVFLLTNAVAMTWTFYYGEVSDWVQSIVGETSVDIDLALLVPYLGLSLFAGMYLIGKTAQAARGSFWPEFLMSGFPPFMPAVWARIGNKPFWHPYLWLMADVVVFGIAFMFAGAFPMVILFVAVAGFPFFLYHLFGCALGEIAKEFGFSKWTGILWICVGPYVLAAIGIAEIAQSLFGMSSVATARQSMAAEPGLMANMLTAPIYQFSLILYFAITIVVWVRGVYKGLQTPSF